MFASITVRVSCFVLLLSLLNSTLDSMVAIGQTLPAPQALEPGAKALRVGPNAHPTSRPDVARRCCVGADR